MVKKYRDLTQKYRSFRLQPDALYQSRIIQTIFNKFTKKGKKTLARRHILKALQQFRFSLRFPRTYNTLLRMVKSLHMQFHLVAKRQGRTILEVPTPIRRNKGDIMSIQTFYGAVTRRRERKLTERLEQEFLSLTLYQSQSTTLRQRSQYMSRVYDERANMEKRWK